MAACNQAPCVLARIGYDQQSTTLCCEPKMMERDMKMNPMILCMVLALTTACGSGGGKDDTADGGGSGCAVYGAQVAASESCEEDASVYEASCEEGSADAHAAGCGTENDAMIECANGAGYDYDCSDDGEPSIEWSDDDPCEEEFGAFLVCAFGG